MSDNSSNNDQQHTNPSAGLPPFVPGLLIVSLLVVMSLLVAWRNYVRRTRLPRHVDAVGPEWPTRWEAVMPGPMPRGGAGRKLEKPQMWEVDGIPNRDVMSTKGLQWEDVMPLSVTMLDSTDPIQNFKQPQPQQPASVEVSPVYLSERSASSLRFPLPRLPFFSRPSRSSTITTNDIENMSSLPDPMATTSHLQLSFMISMPSPYLRTYNPTEEDTTLGTGTLSEKAAVYPNLHSFEGVPEVALGVAVVPLRSTFDDHHDDDKEK